MIPASLVIVADRGSLKAYQVNETPTRGPSLKLVQAFDITDAHGKLIDKVTDLAGRFPVTGSAGAAVGSKAGHSLRHPRSIRRLSIFYPTVSAIESSST